MVVLINQLKITGKKYYLYFHYRLDKKEIFYVGIGTKNGNTFSRATRNKCRNEFWQNIVNKTEYIIFIALESDSRELILEKEKHFIKLFGRKDLGNGSLCNLTNGGDGGVTNTVSKLGKKVFLYSVNGDLVKVFPSKISCAKFLNLDYKTISKTLNFVNNLVFGKYHLSYCETDVKSLNLIDERFSYRWIETYLFDKNGSLLKNFKNTRDCANYLGKSDHAISEVISKGKFYLKRYYISNQNQLSKLPFIVKL